MIYRHEPLDLLPSHVRWSWMRIQYEYERYILLNEKSLALLPPHKPTIHGPTLGILPRIFIIFGPRAHCVQIFEPFLPEDHVFVPDKQLFLFLGYCAGWGHCFLALMSGRKILHIRNWKLLLVLRIWTLRSTMFLEKGLVTHWWVNFDHCWRAER